MTTYAHRNAAGARQRGRRLKLYQEVKVSSKKLRASFSAPKSSNYVTAATDFLIWRRVAARCCRLRGCRRDFGDVLLRLAAAEHLVLRSIILSPQRQTSTGICLGYQVTSGNNVRGSSSWWRGIVSSCSYASSFAATTVSA